MKRRIILEVDVPDGHGERLLMIMSEISDDMEKYKDADLIRDYGLGLEMPQTLVKELSTEYVDHAGKGPT